MLPNTKRDWANYLLQFMVALAVLILIGYVVFTLTHSELKDKNNSAFLVVLGALVGWGSAVLQFCFPANIGAQKQQDTISQLSLAQAAPLTTTTTVETSSGQNNTPNVSDPAASNAGAGGEGTSTGGGNASAASGSAEPPLEPNFPADGVGQEGK